VLLALLLMTLNHRFESFSRVRSALSVVALPIQYLVNWPVQALHVMTGNFTTRRHLLAVNARLRTRQMLLQAKLEKLIAIQQENAQLRALLRTSHQLNSGKKVLVAQLLALASDPFTQQEILNKGSHSGIYVGQPVLDAYGVMGQVIAVGPMTSWVLLITATQSAIPVQDNRNGIRAIAAGTGYAGNLKLLHKADTADIRVGDKFLTSGLGLRFPFGYPVGVVKSVKHSPGQEFANIVLQPTAHIDRSRQMILTRNQKPETRD